MTPFLAALLSQHFDGPMESWDIETLSEESMYAVEADAYWMLCKLLDGIQDHYTNAQPGIQRTVFKLKELVRWGLPLGLICMLGVLIAHRQNQTIEGFCPWQSP